MSQPFTSIAFPIGIDVTLGRLGEERNLFAHVEQLIKQVLLTSPGERVNRPDFGCGLRRMVFAPNSDVGANLLQTLVHQSLDRWLSTVIRVDDVKVTARSETLEVRLVYVVLAKQQRRYLNLAVAR